MRARDHDGAFWKGAARGGVHADGDGGDEDGPSGVLRAVVVYWPLKGGFYEILGRRGDVGGLLLGF